MTRSKCRLLLLLLLSLLWLLLLADLVTGLGARRGGVVSLHFLRSSEEASSGLKDPIGEKVILAKKKQGPIMMEDSLDSDDDDNDSWKYEIGSSEGESDSFYEKGVRGGKTTLSNVKNAKIKGGSVSRSSELARRRLKALLSSAEIVLGLKPKNRTRGGLMSFTDSPEDWLSSSSDESDTSVLVGFNQLSDESVVDFADEENGDEDEYEDEEYDEDDKDDDDEFNINEDDDMVDLTKKHDMKSSNESDADSENAFRSALERQIEELLGRARAKADLGHLGDFPTELQDTLDCFELDVEQIKIQEEVTTFKFRGSSGRRRKLNAKVRRWEHRERLDQSEPIGCGYPVCTIVDSKPKRFVSMCALAEYMVKYGLYRRVLEVQKGSCEDAIEGHRLNEEWSHKRPQVCDCGGHEGCSQPICLNEDGVARSYDNVCKAMGGLTGKKATTVVAVGLGNCKSLYSSCLFTEWWDLDEPCKKGEVESVYVSNVFAKSLGKFGVHRSCPNREISYPAEYSTVDGQDLNGKDIKKLVFRTEKDRIQCFNGNNKHQPKPPHFWADETVKCRDFRMRYCCKNLWGEGVPMGNKGTPFGLGPHDVVVDPPRRKTLFDECDWLHFMSASSGDRIGDVESREKNYRFMKKSTCHLSRFSALFIDARRVNDDTPWDETGETITKISPTYGFYCDNRNNEVLGKKCSDYKVRYCCKKQEPSQWGSWSEWSQCTKSCGGGERRRDRRCVMKEGAKVGCFNDGPYGDKRFKEQSQECNRKSCPKDLQWQDWLQWSQCSSTCGQGVRRRQRACFPGSNGGKKCPPPGDKLYYQDGACHQPPCSNPQWTSWSKWSGCSSTCGLGSRRRQRVCADEANGWQPIVGDDPTQKCPGPDQHSEDCDLGLCPLDGGWTVWQNWGECSVACGENGFRRRFRACANPFPVSGGRQCEGDAVERGPCQQLGPCPVHCIFSSWGEWSQCSVSCGTGPDAGTRQRKRNVAQEASNGGLECDGCYEQAERCIFCTANNTQPGCINKCPVNCILSEWTEWMGQCPNCYKPRNRDFISQISRLRTRYVEHEAENGGEPCVGPNGQAVTMAFGLITEKKPCEPDKDVLPCPVKAGGHVQPTWTPWGQWDPCLAPCGGKGEHARRRRCLYNASFNSHKKKKHKKVHHHAPDCPGDHEQQQLCENLCPETGWTEWDEWSPCQKTCGKGQSGRRRTCRDDGREDLSPEDVTCRGIQREQRVCDSGPCDQVQTLRFRGWDKTGLSGRNALAKDESEKKDDKIIEDDKEISPHRMPYTPVHQKHRQQEGGVMEPPPTTNTNNKAKDTFQRERILTEENPASRDPKARPEIKPNIPQVGELTSTAPLSTLTETDKPTPSLPEILHPKTKVKKTHTQKHSLVLKKESPPPPHHTPPTPVVAAGGRIQDSLGGNAGHIDIASRSSGTTHAKQDALKHKSPSPTLIGEEKSSPSHSVAPKDKKARKHPGGKGGAKKELRRKRRRRRRKQNGTLGRHKNKKGRKGGGKRRKRRKRRKNGHKLRDANTVTRIESQAADAFPPNGLSTGDSGLYDNAFDTWDDEAFEEAHNAIKGPSRSHAHVVEIFKD